MWIDRVKTVLLNILVLCSLILSWLLLNSQPKYDYLHPAQYVETHAIGEKKELSDLIQPKSIVFHYGNKHYTEAGPETVYYRTVLSEMEKWYFFNFSTSNLTNEQWNDIIQNKKGIEIIYPDGIPMEVMRQMFTFRGKADALMTSASRILIYTDKKDDETYALFVSDDGRQTMQARTVVTSRDLDSLYLTLGHSLAEQTALYLKKGGHPMPLYLPVEPFTMKKYVYFYQPAPVQQLVQTLFADFSLTRQVTERDGTVIYTDGSRGVQIPPDMRSIHFYDPLADSYGSSSSDSDMQSVVQFINEHGGWNGDYLLDETRTQMFQDKKTYRFRQYVHSYPIYEGGGGNIGAIQVDLQQAFISGFHRSLIDLDSSFEEKPVQVSAARSIQQHLSRLGVEMSEVDDIYPGYQVEIDEYHLTLVPKWIVRMSGADPMILDANWSEKEGKPNGLAKS